MAKNENRIMMVISIIERGRAKSYISMMQKHSIDFHMQSTAMGTASSEMMDILGLASNYKDVVFSFAPYKAVKALATSIAKDLGSTTGYNGLMMILSTTAIGRITSELILHSTQDIEFEGDENAMASEYQHSLIFITVNQGYTDDVMHVAKKAGATGGTVIRARMTGAEKSEHISDLQIQEEKEIVAIFAPDSIRNEIMSAVNKDFGINSEAQGVIYSVPVDKAFKI